MRWCESPAGEGRVISPGKVAQQVSGTVRNNRRLATMRVFPARMYFYDDTAKGGGVYVGYIGRHLVNTETSTSYHPPQLNSAAGMTTSCT